MLFSSLEFLFGFLPLTMAAVYIAMRFKGVRAAAAILLIASLIFYSWQTPVYFFLIAGSICVNFLLGQRVSRNGSRRMAGLGIAFNLCLLGYFKYAGLFSKTLSDLSGGDFTINGVVLPLAISFFTFQQIAYLVDCLKSDREPYDFLDYALFVAFFPQLIAGPIVHHKDVTPQFQGANFARFRVDDMLAGLFLFAIGLSKKVLIADGLAPIADGVFDQAANGAALAQSEAALGVIAYSFQIYFDFSGYSDMALGLALLFGVRLPMNFNSPYKARSIVDFWRRWHITLSAFLRNYLYIPLGGNRTGAVLRYRNLFIVMLLGGLWHGAAWTFVVWGALHGLFLCINHAWSKFSQGRIAFPPIAAIALTFAATCFAWIFFRAENFSAAFSVIASVSGAYPDAASVLDEKALFSYPLIVVAGAIVWGAPNALELLEKFKAALGSPRTLPGAQSSFGGAHALSPSLVMSLLGGAAAVAIYILMASGPYEFIYFQF